MYVRHPSRGWNIFDLWNIPPAIEWINGNVTYRCCQQSKKKRSLFTILLVQHSVQRTRTVCTAQVACSHPAAWMMILHLFLFGLMMKYNIQLTSRRVKTERAFSQIEIYQHLELRWFSFRYMNMFTQSNLLLLRLLQARARCWCNQICDAMSAHSIRYVTYRSIKSQEYILHTTHIQSKQTKPIPR